MRLTDLQSLSRFHPIGREPHCSMWHAVVEPGIYVELARTIRAKGGRLIALWGSDNLALVDSAESASGPAPARFSLHAAFFVQVHAKFVIRPGLLWVSLDLSETPDSDPSFPTLSAVFPTAMRREQTVYDLLGLRPAGLTESPSGCRSMPKMRSCPHGF